MRRRVSVTLDGRALTEALDRMATIDPTMLRMPDVCDRCGYGRSITDSPHCTADWTHLVSVGGPIDYEVAFRALRLCADRTSHRLACIAAKGNQ